MAGAVSRQRKTEIAERRRNVASLYLRHITQEEIAKSMGVSQVTISRDIKKLTEQWMKEANADITTRKARELAELDDMEKDAALEFNKSKRPDWWNARIKAKERRAKLLGLDAPTKQDINSRTEDVSVVLYLPDNERDNGATED